MDAIPPLLTTGVPSVGVLGLLAWLVIRTMRQSGADRSAYSTELEAVRSRYDSAINRLQERIDRLEGAMDVLRTELEVERKARHQAEDRAAEYRRLLDEATSP